MLVLVFTYSSPCMYTLPYKYTHTYKYLINTYFRLEVKVSLVGYEEFRHLCMTFDRCLHESGISPLSYKKKKHTHKQNINHTYSHIHTHIHTYIHQFHYGHIYTHTNIQLYIFMHTNDPFGGFQTHFNISISYAPIYVYTHFFRMHYRSIIIPTYHFIYICLSL